MAENDMVVVKEEPKDPEDNDIVTTNSEMVLDDILGDDIIGESSGKNTFAPPFFNFLSIH